MFIFIIGITSNHIAVVENQGVMPSKILLTEHYVIDERHSYYIEDSQVNYPYLTDRFANRSFSTPFFFSIGDIFLTLGILMAIIYTTKFVILNRKNE